MTVARSVADVLDDHVTLEVECLDRMFLNVYQPRLQHVGGVVSFLRGHRGAAFASSALMDPISKAFVGALHRYCQDHQVPLVDFVRGQRKDDLAHEHLAEFEAAGGTEGVLFIGRAQEKTAVFRTEKRRNGEGRSYPWIVKSTGMVNHFYFYCVDDDFGPFFIKFCSYFPYNAKLCLLTELREESSMLGGQGRACVATVPAYGYVRRSVTGPALLGGSPARRAGGQWGSVRAVRAA